MIPAQLMIQNIDTKPGYNSPVLEELNLREAWSACHTLANYGIFFNPHNHKTTNTNDKLR